MFHVLAKKVPKIFKTKIKTNYSYLCIKGITMVITTEGNGLLNRGVP
jgi:hypothetical protein